MYRHLPHMYRIVTDGKQAACDMGIECFDPTVQNFREAGQLRYFAYPDAVCIQQTRCTTGRYDFDVQIGQRPGKLYNSSFVIHADQRAFDSFQISLLTNSSRRSLFSRYETRYLLHQSRRENTRWRQFQIATTFRSRYRDRATPRTGEGG